MSTREVNVLILLLPRFFRSGDEDEYTTPLALLSQTLCSENMLSHPMEQCDTVV